ncbi:NAD(P)/FAD-dependent oxidoreductase [Ornithinimicrobium murale]|uniref:NAD(P)/FAD-dependent oxidoreductase n=1 Tax=Ornithinimicrobium murale TaxID=1050153 RepID=UPI003B51070A
MLIVGASVAGVSVAEELREQGFNGEIVLLSDEDCEPYDRPPLSKQFLAGTLPAGRQSLALRDSGWYEKNNVCLRLSTKAAKVTTDILGVRTADDEHFPADHVVIATGASARTLPGWSGLPGVLVLRTLRDADVLAACLERGPGRLVVLGAGFIGLEVATAAADAGWVVQVLERADAPLSRVLPPALGRLCVEGAVGHNVQIDYSMDVLEPAGGDIVQEVRLRDGRTFPADLIVLGVGVVPNTGWLEGSGLECHDGVVCDGSGRTTEPRVWAVGDVARWPNSVTEQHIRVEQWQTARDHGRIVAGAISQCTSTEPLDLPVWDTAPYFWSDLFGRKVQLSGHASPDMNSVITRTGKRVVAVLGDDRLRAVLAIDHPRAIAVGRRLLSRGATFSEGVEWAKGAASASPKPAGRVANAVTPETLTTPPQAL